MNGDLITMTMTPTAARRLHMALLHGSVVLEDHARWNDDAEWLRWAMGRLAPAAPEVTEEPDA